MYGTSLAMRRYDQCPCTKSSVCRKRNWPMEYVPARDAAVPSTPAIPTPISACFRCGKATPQERRRRIQEKKRRGGPHSTSHGSKPGRRSHLENHALVIGSIANSKCHHAFALSDFLDNLGLLKRRCAAA